jgi:hypothetical protein
MAEKMGVHYLTVKNFIRRRRKEYFALEGNKTLMKPCNIIVLPQPLYRRRPIEIEVTVGGLMIDQYANRMEVKAHERPPVWRCHFAEIDPKASGLQPWTIQHSFQAIEGNPVNVV